VTLGGEGLSAGEEDTGGVIQPVLSMIGGGNRGNLIFAVLVNSICLHEVYPDGNQAGPRRIASLPTPRRVDAVVTRQALNVASDPGAPIESALRELQIGRHGRPRVRAPVNRVATPAHSVPAQQVVG